MIHENSLEALESINTDGSKQKRVQEILKVFLSGKSLTDREVLQVINPGSDNMNYVRPRITELIDRDILVQVGKTRHQGRNVRVCRIAETQTQTRMAI